MFSGTKCKRGMSKAKVTSFTCTAKLFAEWFLQYSPSYTNYGPESNTFPHIE